MFFIDFKQTVDSVQRSELFEMMMRMWVYLSIKTCTDDYEQY